MFKIEKITTHPTGFVDVEFKYKIIRKSFDWQHQKMSFTSPFLAACQIARESMDVFRLNVETFVQLCDRCQNGDLQKANHRESKYKKTAINLGYNYIKWIAEDARGHQELFEYFLKTEEHFVQGMLPSEDHWLYKDLLNIALSFAPMAKKRMELFTETISSQAQNYLAQTA